MAYTIWQIYSRLSSSITNSLFYACSGQIVCESLHSFFDRYCGCKMSEQSSQTFHQLALMRFPFSITHTQKHKDVSMTTDDDVSLCMTEQYARNSKVYKECTARIYVQCTMRNAELRQRTADAHVKTIARVQLFRLL